MTREPAPVLFATDLGPAPSMIDRDYGDALSEMGMLLPRPRAILVMSGHWLADGELKLTGSPKPETIHDFGGFPRRFYGMRYASPGSPDLAARAADLLNTKDLRASVDRKRGLDHGAWTPLRWMFPKADIPVVQLTVPYGWEPSRIMAIGRALQPLRGDGVLIAVHGNLLHNLRMLDAGSREAFDWALEFDAWLERRLDPPNVRELLDYRRLAPNAELAAPTTEHFDPLFFALGAAEGEPLRRYYRNLTGGSALALLFTLGAWVEEPAPLARRAG